MVTLGIFKPSAIACVVAFESSLRISEVVDQKIVVMERAEDGETFTSGMASISTTLLGLLSSGDHFAASADVYGGTYGLLTEDLPRFGIEVTKRPILISISNPRQHKNDLCGNIIQSRFESLGFRKHGRNRKKT